MNRKADAWRYIGRPVVFIPAEAGAEIFEAYGARRVHLATVGGPAELWSYLTRLYEDAQAAHAVALAREEAAAPRLPIDLPLDLDLDFKL